MTSSSFGYLLCEGGRNIRANKQMSIASIGVLVACMLLIGTSILFSMNVNSIMGYVESMNEAVVFIKDSASTEEIEALGSELKNMSNISKITYVSKEDALKLQMDTMQDAAGLLEGLVGEENPLPASYRIKIKDLSDLTNTVSSVNSMVAVDYVSAPTDVATTLVDIKRGVTIAGIFIVSILGMVSVIIISNTIKVTIFNRRREISIMKYVGATDAFIRIPFLVEGVIIGIVSAIIAFSFLWLGYEYTMQWLSETPSSWMNMAYGSLIPFVDIWPIMLSGFTAAGAAFGVFGSLFFVSKYLKV